MRRVAGLALAAVLLASGPVRAADLYVWKDARGVQHVTDKPPADPAVPYEKVPAPAPRLIGDRPPADPVAAPPRAAPPPPAAPAADPQAAERARLEAEREEFLRQLRKRKGLGSDEATLRRLENRIREVERQLGQMPATP